MKYRMIISDYDGTLAAAGTSEINSETVSAIKEFTAKGGKFVICTGRAFESIRNISLKYGLKGLAVSVQGAMISDIETGKVIFSKGIEAAAGAELAERFLKDDGQTIVYIGDVFYYENYSPFVDFYESKLKIKGVKVDNLSAYIKERGDYVTKLGLLCESEDVSDTVEKYNALYKGKIIFNSGAAHMVEAVSPEYHKGAAVRFLSNYYGIPYGEILTVGDSTNDIPLLDGEWHGVAVGGAVERLKKVAKEITVPLEENPVLTLIKKYCL